MKSIVQSIPGYRINEYMVILNPPQELRERIGLLKKEFAETYKTSLNNVGKSHIMLAGFTQYAMMEERLLSRLRTIAMGHKPFKMELKDFGAYPTHSLYINVKTKEPVRNLVKELKGFQQLMTLNKDHKPHFPDDPQISIARKLLPWQFEKGWQVYTHRHFTGRFIADNMMLLKRRQGELPWQIAERFEFKNLPVLTRQGELF